MSKNNDHITKVIDIGARYGIHPSWKDFDSDINFYLIEADKNEVHRLNKKYSSYKNIKAYYYFICEKNNSSVIFNFRKNKALSGSNPFTYENIVLLKKSKTLQNNVLMKKKINTTSLDVFLSEKKIDIDFIKVDTEGNEHQIITNSEYIKKNILGLRSEVHFNKKINQNTCSFNLVHSYLLENDFILSSFDYEGRGDNYSNLISSSSKYGVLNITDAIWIKNPLKIIDKYNIFQILKLSCFCFLNNSPDIGLWMIDNSYKRLKNFRSAKNTKILRFIKLLTMRHLKDLRLIPNQNIQDHKKFYEKIFKEEFLLDNKFYESKDANPY